MNSLSNTIGLTWILLRATLLLGLMGQVSACAPMTKTAERPHESAHPATKPPMAGAFARMLTATWSEEGQGTLEHAAKSGLVVFGNVGGTLTLLPGCRMNGQYRYFAIKPRRQHLDLDDQQLVDVNVAGEAGARGPTAPLALELVRVGRLTTTRRAGDGATLMGSCEGASHYARTLSVGDVVDKLASGAVGPPACLQATDDDALPPTKCRRFLRVELVALTGARFDTSNGQIAFCPQGWAQSDGICVERTTAKGYECGDDAAECRLQCNLGNPASCTRLGYFLAHGEGGFVRDDKRALSYYERACGEGYPPACFNIGVLHALAGSAPKEQQIAATYWGRACSDGYPAACSNLGALYSLDSSSSSARDTAATLFGRACSGGDPVGCMNAVVVIRKTERADVDQKVGALLDFACEGDVAAGCLELADWLGQHGATPDIARAALEKACRLGSQEACRHHPEIQEL